MKEKKKRELATLIRLCDSIGALYSKSARGKSNFIDESKYRTTRNIHEVNMGEYNRKGMHIFGANVQLSRAIPNIADGFKPNGRRVLYAMSRISHADKKLKKALGLIGDVIKIHPHGDSSVEDTITLFSKDWELNYPLVLIDGNNGSPDGDTAAAARYLDARISDYAYDCYFADWDSRLVEMRPTYNQDEMEPDYLISKFPDLLLRPSTGFTFGKASSIPSYNMVEAFNAMIELIKDRDYNPVLIPDMPSGCIILDEGKFKEIAETGKGSFRMRAEIEIDEKKSQLIVLSIPYQVKLKDVKEKIVALRGTSLASLKDMFDGSDGNGINLELTFAPGTDLNAMKSILYKKTSLETVFGVQMRYVDMQQGKPLLYTLKEIMLSWLDNRRTVKRKYYINKLVLAKERLNILNILIDICDDTDYLNKIIKLIRKSETDEIIKSLTSRYDISSTQANGLSKIRLGELSATSYAQYKLERKKLQQDIPEYDSIIHSAKKIDKRIIEELEYAIRKYSKPRRCRIVKYIPEEDEMDKMISTSNHVIVITKNGYIKKLPENTKSIGELNSGDVPTQTMNVSNRDMLILFDRKGLVHKLNVWDIPDTSQTSKGLSLSQYIRLAGPIVQVLSKSELTDKSYFIFITKNGMIKKSECNKFAFKTSVSAMILKNKDELVSVTYGTENSDIIIFTKNGMGTRFNTDEFTPTSRMSAGVIGMNVAEDDEVRGITRVKSKDTHIMVITERGMGKVCSLDSFTTSKRRGDVLKLTSLVGEDKLLNVIACAPGSTFLVVLKEDNTCLTFEDFAELTRAHYGKKVVPVKRGDMIIDCIRLH